MEYFFKKAHQLDTPLKQKSQILFFFFFNIPGGFLKSFAALLLSLTIQMDMIENINYIKNIKLFPDCQLSWM